jgi:protein-S-isoprenylcysteine O-methyltransferase Ste14
LPSRFRVPAGYAVGVLALLLARTNGLSLLLSLPLVIGGEALRIWASGHIEKTRRLATGGPYAHTRNPLYVGSLLLALGAATASASSWLVLAVAAYLLAFYPFVIREEASFLRQTFPEEYGRWARDVPLFLPRLDAAGPRATTFAWARVAQNREWRTAIALPVVIALLWARGLLR